MTDEHQFHLRAYVLITGTYTVHLSRTMLALFSGSPYVPPTSNEELDLKPHLTNTCLQVSDLAFPLPAVQHVECVLTISVDRRIWRTNTAIRTGKTVLGARGSASYIS